LGSDTGWRVKGVLIIKPIVYGNGAPYFGKKRRWWAHPSVDSLCKTLQKWGYVGICEENPVVLNESYGNPLRVITKPPYEITETGWGEF
jgi:YEATS domain-containing protein 4